MLGPPARVQRIQPSIRPQSTSFAPLSGTPPHRREGKPGRRSFLRSLGFARRADRRRFSSLWPAHKRRTVCGAMKGSILWTLVVAAPLNLLGCDKSDDAKGEAADDPAGGEQGHMTPGQL